MLMSNFVTPSLEQALAAASDDFGLPSYYRDCVRPLLNMPRSQWPACCGSNCEPCAQTLINVARAVQKRMGSDEA